MALQSTHGLSLNNQLLSHFIMSELQSAEVAALREGQAGLDALASSDRYASAMALIDAIHDAEPAARASRREPWQFPLHAAPSAST